MSTAQLVTLALIIFIGLSIALALLWGKFAKVGRGKDVKPPPKPDERETAANHYEGRM